MDNTAETSPTPTRVPPNPKAGQDEITFDEAEHVTQICDRLSILP
jgi:hypothetical protein